MTPVYGNLLLVSNYPSDTSYAWWLMEHFWKCMAERYALTGGMTFLAYPEITSVSEAVLAAPIETVEFTIELNSLAQALKVRRLILEHNITTIYFTDRPYFSPYYALLRLWGVKRILVHDHTPGDRPAVRGLKGAIKALRNRVRWFSADRIFCVSDLMRERNMENGRVPGEKCIVIQNGISPVHCGPADKQIVRKDMAVSDRVVVVTSGRAHPYKRFDFIIDAADRLRTIIPELEVVFLLIGDGPYMPQLQSKISRLGLEESVRLLGYRKDVRALLCASDIAIHASLGEGFSLSIIEYMSAGLPVLVPDIPSVCQAIEHGSTGLIYSSRDVVKLTACIQKLAQDAQLREDMGRRAKITADSKYNLEMCTTRFIDVVDSLFDTSR